MPTVQSPAFDARGARPVVAEVNPMPLVPPVVGRSPRSVCEGGEHAGSPPSPAASGFRSSTLLPNVRAAAAGMQLTAVPTPINRGSALRFIDSCSNLRNPAAPAPVRFGEPSMHQKLDK